MMNCPACNKEMVEKDFGGVAVDVCENGCKGIWFDWFELMKLDEKNEGMGNALKEALKSPRTNNEDREKLKCPKCGIPMHIHQYRNSKEVNVDECYACAGFFLDSGELRQIRDSFMSEEQVDAYAKSLIDDMPEYAKAKEELEKQKQRIAAINKYTKFLRVSYYITRK
ncbi:MAG: zf-TFIIB domain-containing protein [Candidatus Omnitrophica bacterium]|nr:zf-TFIIB domain-containing protein [Candidatus Omnitrophota bacterium]